MPDDPRQDQPDLGLVRRRQLIRSARRWDLAYTHTHKNNGKYFISIDLFPFDAGTLDGTDFTSSTTATAPQGTITSLRNGDVFSDNKIAQLRLELKAPALTRGVAAEEAIESIIVTWGEVAAAGGYHVMWKSGAEDYDTDGTLGRRDVVVGGKTITHTITGLTGGVEYDVQVIAYNEAGQSSRPPTYERRATATAIGANNTVLVGNSTQLLPGTERLTIGTAIQIPRALRHSRPGQIQPCWAASRFPISVKRPTIA